MSRGSVAATSVIGSSAANRPAAASSAPWRPGPADMAYPVSSNDRLKYDRAAPLGVMHRTKLNAGADDDADASGEIEVSKRIEMSDHGSATPWSQSAISLGTVVSWPKAQSMTVTSDNADYAPGSTATFTVAGVRPGSSVEFQVQDLPKAPGANGVADVYAPFTVKDGGPGDLDGVANGVVVAQWQVPANGQATGADLKVAATANGQTATAFFSDAANKIVTENQKSGTPLSTWAIHGSIENLGDSQIEGFATQISTNVGQTVSFKINTASSGYTIDIYRLGYYGGDGATLVTSMHHSGADNQPNPIFNSATRTVDAGNWSVTDSWTVPGTATSGVYFAKLTTDTGDFENMIPFIVRNDGATSDIVFQTSDTTWEAYNPWGGYNLYQGPSGSNADRAYAVSYNRPIDMNSTSLLSGPQDYVFGEEFPAIYWLEQNGYSVNYISGIDAATNAGSLLNAKTYMDVGHDEYWTQSQFANVTAARNAGVNLAFLSGNEAYWDVALAPSYDASQTPNRTIVEYKDIWSGAQLDPNGTASGGAGIFQDPLYGPGTPQNSLTGTIFRVDEFGSLTNITVPASMSQLYFWSNTSIASGNGGTLTNLLGYEYDVDLNNGFRPAGLIDLSSTTNNVSTYLLDNGVTTGAGTATHSLTMYQDTTSGALVFSAGTVMWSWGLSKLHTLYRGLTAPVSTDVQQAMVNLFAEMGVTPQTLQASLVLAQQAANGGATGSTTTGPSLFSASATPAQTALNDGQPIEVGMKFTSSVAGQVTALKFYRSAADTGTDVLDLWTSSGANLGSTTFTNAAASGWQTVTLATPVTIAANTTYVVSYHTTGEYVATNNYFTGDVTSGQLTAPSTTNAGGNGVYAYGGTNTAGTFPTVPNAATNYWADVVFAAGTTTNTTPVVAPAATGNLFSASATPAQTALNDGQPIEVGMKFTSSVAGQVTALKFYRSAADTGTDVLDLWTASGANLGSATFTDTAASGWQTVNLATPVTIAANTTYVASYHTTGEYVATNNYFTGDVTSGQLTAPSTTNAGGNGVYAYGGTNTAGLFPTVANAATNYWADVVFAAGTTTNTTPVVAPAATGNLFSASATPAQTALNDGQPIEVGMKFTTSVAGQVTALKFYRSAADTGTDVLDLWTASGANLGSATFTDTAASGWQTVTLATPVTIAANTTYVASYHTTGEYVATNNYFTGDVTSGQLTAPSTTNAGGNGVYAYGGTNTAGTFPTVPNAATNYWADVVFAAGTTTNTTPVVAPAATGNLFSASATPAQTALNDGQPIEVGMKFTTSVAGQVTALKFYRSAADTGTDVLDLWTASGANLGSATFTDTAASGWQTVNLATPVTIAANTTYVASYHTTGEYVATNNYFTGDVTSGQLTAPSTTNAGGNGVYAYGGTNTAGLFPTNTFSANNYFADVVFKPQLAG